MTSLTSVLREISGLVRVEPTFSTSNVCLGIGEASELLEKLRVYQKPDNFVLVSERPTGEDLSRRGRFQYKKNMSEFIVANTGILIPGRPAISPRFYESIADFLGL